jgi:nitrate reductase NapE component
MSTAGARRGRFPWLGYLLALFAILVFALWPVATVALSSWLAQANGCMLDEGNVHPCMIGGSDWGPALYTMFVLGWFMLATVPIGAFALAAWLLVIVVHYLVWRRRRPV